MRDRTLFDLILVLVAGVLAYTETFGWADPIANLDALLGVFAAIDVRAYLVAGGLLGVVFVGYLVAYLPKKEAQRSVRKQQKK
jgi:Mg2+/citrate symporter